MLKQGSCLVALMSCLLWFSGLVQAQEEPGQSETPALPQMEAPLAPAQPLPAVPPTQSVPLSTAESYRGLLITQGAMQLGGNLGVTITGIYPEEGDGTTGYTLNINPTFGYFIINGLELQGALAVSAGFGDALEKSSKTVAVGVGARYFFDLEGRVYPYVGFNMGPQFIIPDKGDTATLFALNIPLGILIALNQHVAVSVGTNPSVAFGMSSNAKGTLLNVPIGYLGVEGFF